MADEKKPADSPPKKEAPSPSESQFPRPTMKTVHGSLDSPKDEKSLNLSRRNRET
jgi:hypothetical protein